MPACLSTSLNETNSLVISADVLRAHAGRCSYTNWTTTAMGCDDFYTDPNAIQLYKNHVRTMLTRVNTVTGLEYGSDPTIMGESPGLAIENPRCF